MKLFYCLSEKLPVALLCDAAVVLTTPAVDAVSAMHCLFKRNCVTPCVWIFVVKSLVFVCIVHRVMGQTSTARQLGIVRHRVKHCSRENVGTNFPFGDDVSVMLVHNRQPKRQPSFAYSLANKVANNNEFLQHLEVLELTSVTNVLVRERL